MRGKRGAALCAAARESLDHRLLRAPGERDVRIEKMDEAKACQPMASHIASIIVLFVLYNIKMVIPSFEDARTPYI